MSAVFIRVIQGTETDSGGLRRQFDWWRTDVAPRADGWLGATLGSTTGGDHIAVFRFESEEAAAADDARPEQKEWWTATAALYRDLEIRDCPLVQLMVNGGRDDAGFVQVLQGRARDRERVLALNDEFSRRLPDHRPGCIGATVAWNGPVFTDTVYFPSEAVARDGEVAIAAMTGDYKDMVVEWNGLVDGLRFFDLPEPQLLSP